MKSHVKIYAEQLAALKKLSLTLEMKTKVKEYLATEGCLECSEINADKIYPRRDSNVIDEFIQDFSKMKSKGYKMNQITADFNKFLEDRAALQNRSEAMEGINQNQFFSLWGQFVGD